MIQSAWKSQEGVSLIELMIAITLSIFIAGGMIGLFINAKQSYRVNENMSRLQENARFAVSFISRDVRMADFRECQKTEPLGDAIFGEDKTDENESDIDMVTIVYQYQVKDSKLCKPADTKTTTTVYSIQYRDDDPDLPGLYRSIDDGDAVELVEGIESLQILYGEDVDGDNVPNYFVDASSITGWAQVISIRFILTARTLEKNITTDGDRVTRDFTSTITLRNRLP